MGAEPSASRKPDTAISREGSLAGVCTPSGMVVGKANWDAWQPDGAGAPGGALCPPAQLGETWVGVLPYDLGRLIEPRAGTRNRPACGRALAAWARLGGVQVQTVEDGIGATTGTAYQLGALRSTTGRARFMSDVARVKDYLHAGDAYQVNLAHVLRGAFTGCTRALARDLLRAARPKHGAYVELPDVGSRRRAVISLSPELFLEIDPPAGDAPRGIRTRPMKGTRRAPITTASGGGLDASAAGDLRDSEKDQAELNMIVDLMRNDLSRVCVLPGVRVTRPRDIEAHASVLQATATIEGHLRAGTTLDHVLRAAFPGGSVTGAPKIRAMQIIDELEPEARGVYCGSIALVRPGGAVSLNIAIRTLLIEGEAGASRGEIRQGTLRYSVGAGITVGSDPESEWQETLDKAALILDLAGGLEDSP